MVGLKLRDCVSHIVTLLLHRLYMHIQWLLSVQFRISISNLTIIVQIFHQKTESKAQQTGNKKPKNS